MRCRVAVLLPLLLASAVLPALCDDSLKPPVQVNETQRFDFAPGGAIHIDGSRGDVYVEAWDEPRVVLTVTKFLPFEYLPGRADEASLRLQAVHVTAEQSKPGELEIDTSRPSRRDLWWPPSWGTNRNPVRIEYHLRVPRSSRLNIRHDIGLVSINGVSGDIHASCHRGDIVLWLPESGTYAIDAKNRFGKVSSDFLGRTHARLLVGQRFEGANATAVQHLVLRMGFGGITLKPLLKESATKDAAGSK